MAGSRIRTVRRVGSKARHLDFILPLLPLTEKYVEPFCGSAAVLLNRPKSRSEVLNDINPGVFALLDQLSGDPRPLVRACRLTPRSRSELALCQGDTGDRLELARRFYVRSTHTFAGSGEGTAFGRVLKGAAMESEPQLARMARRIRGATVTNEDWLDCVDRHDSPGTLFYLDPPYLPEACTEGGGDMYKSGMDRDAHRVLLDRLLEIKGRAALSGYPHAMYDDALLPNGWRKVASASRKVAIDGRKAARPSAVETVWTNYEPSI